MKGIDVSKHQGLIDWKQVAASGVEFVIIRAGFGQNNVDQYFIENIVGAHTAGLKIGVYWFMYCSDNVGAIQNAEKCLSVISLYKDCITLGVFSDWEYDSDEYSPGQTDASRTEFVRLFNERIESAGYKSGTYLNIDYYKNHFIMDRLLKWDIWLADYSGECDYPCIMRQYTSKGSVDGIKGGVDMNTYFGVTTTAPKAESKGFKIELIILRQGSNDEQVATVQRLLNALGYKGKDGNKLKVDKMFGANTAYAVELFQEHENLEKDCIVGPKTWEHLLK